MAALTTARDVLHSYTFTWGVYECFLDDCDCHPQVAQITMALLLCFDQGTNQAISHLPNMSTTALGHLVTEDNCVIQWLHMRNLLASPPTLLLSALCQDSRLDHPLFFLVNRDLIVRAVADLLDGMCTLIFDDRLYHLLQSYQTGLIGRNPELKAPYARVTVIVPKDYRSMFVTFSRGRAVEQDEIFDYFREYVLFQHIDACMHDCYTLDL